jgi:hypothetical protein
MGTSRSLAPFPCTLMNRSRPRSTKSTCLTPISSLARMPVSASRRTITLSRSRRATTSSLSILIAAEHVQYPPWKLGRLRTHLADLPLATTPAEEQVDVADVGVDREP